MLKINNDKMRSFFWADANKDYRELVALAVREVISKGAQAQVGGSVLPDRVASEAAVVLLMDLGILEESTK